MLGYNRTVSKRFKIFVANKVEFIKEYSDKFQWQYISSKQKPVYHASREIGVCKNNKDRRLCFSLQIL